MSYAERRRAWTRKWALMREEYLQGRVLDALIYPYGDMLVRWECPICGDSGKPLSNEKLARTAGRGHMKTHISSEDSNYLEEIKVLNMPEDFLTNYQYHFRQKLLDAGRELNEPLKKD